MVLFVFVVMIDVLPLNIENDQSLYLCFSFFLHMIASTAIHHSTTIISSPFYRHHIITMMKEEEEKGDSFSLSLPRKASSLTNAISISSKQVSFTNTIHRHCITRHET